MNKKIMSFGLFIVVMAATAYLAYKSLDKLEDFDFADGWLEEPNLQDTE